MPSRASEPVGVPYQTFGRYALFGEIASGGVASVHLGRLFGAAGFARTVAIKRLRREYATDRQFVAMFVDEARIAARVRHPNVVQTVDVFAERGEVFVVFDYVHGESLRRLLIEQSERQAPLEPRLAAGVLCGVLHGLQAAHDALDEQGEPLGLVHRDVSPENVIVDVGGIARVVDFGIARAHGRIESTRSGQLKGKVRYMSPEQVRNASETLDRRSDVFAAALVFWEALTGASPYGDGDIFDLVASKLHPVPAPSEVGVPLPRALERVLMNGLQIDPGRRYPDARTFALEIEAALEGVASQHAVSAWLEDLVGAELAQRQQYLLEVERTLPSDDLLARALLPAEDGPAPRARRNSDIAARAPQPVLDPDATTQMVASSEDSTVDRVPGKDRSGDFPPGAGTGVTRLSGAGQSGRDEISESLEIIVDEGTVDETRAADLPPLVGDDTDVDATETETEPLAAVAALAPPKLPSVPSAPASAPVSRPAPMAAIVHERRPSPPPPAPRASADETWAPTGRGPVAVHLEPDWVSEPPFEGRIDPRRTPTMKLRRPRTASRWFRWGLVAAPLLGLCAALAAGYYRQQDGAETPPATRAAPRATPGVRAAPVVTAATAAAPSAEPTTEPTTEPAAVPAPPRRVNRTSDAAPRPRPVPAPKAPPPPKALPPAKAAPPPKSDPPKDAAPKQPVEVVNDYGY